MIPWTAACQASLPITNSQNCSVSCLSSWWCHPTLSSCYPLILLPSIFPIIRVFSSESVLPIRPKNWSFSYSISLSNEYSGLITLGLTGLLSLQSNGLSTVFSNSTVQKHPFFGTQLSLWFSSPPYMTTGKTIALTRQTFVDKVMSLVFNMLSRLVIAFLPWNKCVLISWLQSSSAVILEPLPPPPKKKSVIVSLIPHLFATKLWDPIPWY